MALDIRLLWYRDWTKADVETLDLGQSLDQVESVLGTASPVTDAELARHRRNFAEVRKEKDFEVYQWTSLNPIVVCGFRQGKLAFRSIKPLTGEEGSST